MKNYFWIARDKTNNNLAIYNTKPTQLSCGDWSSNPDGDPMKDISYKYDFLQIDNNLFKRLKWTDKPIKVKLIPIKD